jgi:hypothetical protein
MAVDPAIVYALTRKFAERLETFVAEHAEEWDGGSIGYEAAELHEMAEEILNTMEARG